MKMLLLQRQSENTAKNLAIWLSRKRLTRKSLNDLFRARCRLVRAFFTGVLLLCIFSLAAQLDNKSGILEAASKLSELPACNNNIIQTYDFDLKLAHLQYCDSPSTKHLSSMHATLLTS